MTEELKETSAAKFLNGLSRNASVDALDVLIRKLEESSETIHELRDQEMRLRSSDTSTERQNLRREADKLDALRAHIGTIHAVLGDQGLAALQKERDHLEALEGAANLLAGSFESEPLAGGGRLALEGSLGVSQALL